MVYLPLLFFVLSVLASAQGNNKNVIVESKKKKKQKLTEVVFMSSGQQTKLPLHSAVLTIICCLQKPAIKLTMHEPLQDFNGGALVVVGRRVVEISL